MIQIDNLSFSYGSKRVLENISLQVSEGNIYGLLGENGVGKTTLLTLLCGLKKPEAGTITVDGRNPFDREPSLLADQFYLPDEVVPVHARAIDFAKENGVFWPRFDLEKFGTILKEFEVDSAQRMDAMSAGQLKKAWISFALACNAKYYYLDEPTNGLDIPSKAQFRKAVTKYTLEDSAIVISTHQVRDLENIIDPIIILDNKAVLVNASVEEISGRLFFDYGTELQPGALYLEQTPGGCIQVYPNTTGEESKVNVEAFFNAVHAHKDLVQSMFNHQ
ncbi:MAG: ATP-binding cassette domain-containing protein [Bacteroidales bacterium]|nr:ATP-binding cassette domain-containing protein [Bacteroidales bacterium]